MQMVYEKRALRSQKQGLSSMGSRFIRLTRTVCKAQNFACVGMAICYIALVVPRIHMLLLILVACPKVMRSWAPREEGACTCVVKWERAEIYPVH